jgi:hypothetical protein
LRRFVDKCSRLVAAFYWLSIGWALGGGGRFGPEGSDGRLQVVDGRLECVADGYVPSAAKAVNKFIESNLDWLTADESDRSAIKDAAYDQYDRDLAAAWRRPR